MKIDFDVRYRPEIERGEYKVMTVVGNYPAQILKWDAKNTEGKTIIASYLTPVGEYCLQTTGTDLYLLHDLELTDFEVDFIRIVHKTEPNVFTTERLNAIRTVAAKVKAAAEREIINDVEKKFAKDGMSIMDAVAFDEGYKTAKELMM